MPTFDIKIPKTGESVTECTITVIHAKVGDLVQEDDELFEVTSAKTAASVPSPVAGKVVQINYTEGETVPVGQVLLVIDTAAGASAEPAAAPTAAASPAPEASAQPSASPVVEQTLTKGSIERWYSPVVLELAKKAKVSQDELDKISGTGFGGRVSKADITRYIEQ